MSITTENGASTKLFKRLGHELFQTETSAALHCRREAERLGNTPPSQALLAVANHAQDVLRDLPTLAALTSIPESKKSSLVGRMFSEIRDKVADRIIDSERSYRGTLLGARHGMDLVQLLRCAAERYGDEPLASFCESWLEERGELVQRLADELDWFARNPQAATALSGTAAARRSSETETQWEGL